MGNAQGQVAPECNTPSLSPSQFTLIFNELKVYDNANAATILEARAYIKLGGNDLLWRSSYSILVDDVDINSEFRKAEELLTSYLESQGFTLSGDSQDGEKSNILKKSSGINSSQTVISIANETSTIAKSVSEHNSNSDNEPLVGDTLTGDSLSGDSLSGEPLMNPELFTSNSSNDQKVEQPLLDMLDKKLKAAKKSRSDFDIDFQDRESVKQLISQLSADATKVF